MRVLIVCVVFIAGIFVGNIYMPQKNLQHNTITAMQEPLTSLDAQREPDLDAALKALRQQEGPLSPANAELIQKTLILQAYKTAKAQYESALIEVRANPQSQAEFLKARDNYLKTIAALEAAFPPPPPAAEPQAAPQQELPADLQEE